MSCVIIASKDEGCIQQFGSEIKSLGWQLTIARSDVEILDRVAEGLPDFMILDLDATESRPAMIVSAVHHIKPSLRVIVLARRSKLEDAQVVEQGIFYYTAKTDTAEVVKLMQTSLERSEN